MKKCTLSVMKVYKTLSNLSFVAFIGGRGDRHRENKWREYMERGNRINIFGRRDWWNRETKTKERKKAKMEVE